jgi:hypothetical protein
MAEAVAREHSRGRGGRIEPLGVAAGRADGAFHELPPSCIEYLADSVRQHAMWARFGEISLRTARDAAQAGMVSQAIEHLLIS